MNIRTITITAITITALALPALVAAQGPGRGPHSGMRGGGFGAEMLLCRVGDELQLSAEQKAQIEAVIEASKAQSETLRDQLQDLRENAREARDPGVFDEAAVRTHAAQVNDLKTELMIIRMKSRAEVHNILTPEQQQQLEELREERGERRGRRGRHGRR